MKIVYRIIAGRVQQVAVVTNSFDEVRAKKLGFRHVEYAPAPVGSTAAEVLGSPR